MTYGRTRCTAVVLGLVALTMSGCEADTQLVAEVEVEQSSAALTASGSLYVYVTDSRDLTNVTVTFQGYDTVTGHTISDFENTGNLPGTASYNPMMSTMAIYNITSGDALHQTSYGYCGSCRPGYSTVYMSPSGFPASAPQFASGQVKIHANINGACHEDFHNFATWEGALYLQFNGNGGTWDGSCWRGDFLKAY